MQSNTTYILLIWGMKPHTCIKRAAHTGTYTVPSLIGFPHWYSLCCWPSAALSDWAQGGRGPIHTVCVCVLVCVCLRAQTAWSAVPSYRKSRGRPPLVICAGEVEHDPSFPPLYLPPFSFSRLTLSPFMSSASPFVICIWFSYCASLPPRLTSTLPLFSAICPHFFFFPLPLRKMLWKVAVVPYLCQYGAAWPNDWWKTFRAVFVNGTFMSRSKTFLHW